MEGITIRKAVPDDAPLVADLCRALLAYYEIDPPGTPGEMAHALRLNAFDMLSRIEILLADLDGKTVGLLIFEEMYSVAVCHPVLFIQDLFVLAEARGRQVGQALMARLARIADERAIEHVDWTADRWNRSAQRFYRRIGATLRGEKLVYRLTGLRLARLSEEDRSATHEEI